MAYKNKDIRCTVLALAIIFLPQSVYAKRSLSAPHSPMRSCEIRQSSWCLMYGAASYEDKPSVSEGIASTWLIRGPASDDLALIINEPKGCRTGLSDEVQIIGGKRSINVDGKRLDSSTVRIKSDKTCDLEIIYPGSDLDPKLSAFFNAMSLIAPCSNETCRGPSIGSQIRRLINP